MLKNISNVIAFRYFSMYGVDQSLASEFDREMILSLHSIDVLI